MAPKYCAEIDTVQFRFRKDHVELEYLSVGTVIKKDRVDFALPRNGDSMTLKMHGFIDISEPPRQYSVEDLMKMLAEKKD